MKLQDRIGASTFLLLVIMVALASHPLILHIPSHQNQDEISLTIARFACIRTKLPSQAEVGFLADEEGRPVREVGDPHSNMDYFLSAYAFAPRIIVDNFKASWVIVDFSDSDESRLAVSRLFTEPYDILTDCGNGILLVHRKSN